MNTAMHIRPSRVILPTGHVWLDPDRTADTLTAGAHLVTPRHRYAHHGIYTGAGRVVHYAGMCRQRIRGPVEEVPLLDFTRGQPLAHVPRPLARYRGSAAVARARSRLGEDAYNLLTNNCEHFCNWCLEGLAYSEQVETLKTLPGRLVEKLLTRAGRT